MQSIVGYELHLRLLDHFGDCYHSLQKLRVSYPSFNGERLHFKINFDKFVERKQFKPLESRFGLCRTTMHELEVFSKDFARRMHEFIDLMKQEPTKTRKRQLTRLRELLNSDSLKAKEWKSHLAEVEDILYGEED